MWSLFSTKFFFSTKGMFTVWDHSLAPSCYWICIWNSGKEHLSITIVIVPTLIFPELVWVGHCYLCLDYIFYEWFQCRSAVEKWPKIVFSAKWLNKLLSGTSYVLCMLNMVQIQESVMIEWKKKKQTIVVITFKHNLRY